MARMGDETFFRTLHPHRIAILKPSALGDVVQTLPLLPVLRERFPSSRITWIIQRELQDLVSGHPDLDDILCLDRRPRWSDVGPFVSALRQRRFDLIFDLQGLLRSAVITRLSGARWRVGLETAREGAAYACNVIIPGTGRLIPAHARYWRVAEALELGHRPQTSLITTNVTDFERAKGWLQHLPRPILAVQWGAKWITKRWPLESFRSLLLKAGRRWGGSVVIVGGRGEATECEWLCEQLQTAADGPVTLSLAGRTSIKELAAVLAQVDAVVSNDSGPLHLGAALGRPAFGLFTCTSPIRSGPPGDRHVMISTEIACAASYKKTCPHHGSQHMACHQELTVERAWQGLLRLGTQAGWTTQQARAAA